MQEYGQLHAWFLDHIAVATQGNCGGFLILKSVAEFAGGFAPMAPLGRVARMRAARKQERPFGPAARARRQARREKLKHEAVRAAAVSAVTIAADAFMGATRDAFGLTIFARGLDPADLMHRLAAAVPDVDGALQLAAPAFPREAFGPGRGLVARVPGIDAEGRVLVPIKGADGVIHYWYGRRTRALARLTTIERRAFVAAIRAHPDAAQGKAREARELFADVMRDARRRDDAVIVGSRSREGARDG